MDETNTNSLCKQAEPYYYDLLGDSGRETVPESVANHIKKCLHCREQINQLKEVLSQADNREPRQGQVSPGVTMLKYHFAYLGRRVTCKAVRPFLPTLLEPALKVGIPTPITAHIDRCPQCSRDLETIRRLNLNRKQLNCLSQMFAEGPAVDTKLCEKTRSAIPSVVSMIPSAEILRHLCLCSQCRELIYKRREMVRKELLPGQNDYSCEEVQPSDIFDFVVPYGIDLTGDPYEKTRKSLASHIAACPKCLDKMQQLHNAIYNIADRPDSGVVTIYSIDESAGVKSGGKYDDIYAGFPVRVEVTDDEGEQPEIISYAPAAGRKQSAVNLKLFSKIAVAAAILIGIALLINIPSAKAISLDQIYSAVEKIKNVYISKFAPDSKKPMEERWVSRELNLYKLKTKESSILWDIRNKVKKTVYLNTRPAETTPLSDDEIARIGEKISDSMGLMPFPNISEIPKDAEWKHVTGNSLRTVKGIDVYDLIWPLKEHDGFIPLKKCRFFVNLKTSLPQRIEVYVNLLGDGKYTLVSITVVEYLSDKEIQAAIGGISL